MCTSVFIQKHSNGLFGHFNLVVSYENVITHRPHCIFGRLLFLLPSFHCLYTKPKLSLGLMKFLLSWLSAPFKDEDYLELDMKFEDSHTCNYWSLLTLFTPTTNVLPVFPGFDRGFQVPIHFQKRYFSQLNLAIQVINITLLIQFNATANKMNTLLWMFG